MSQGSVLCVLLLAAACAAGGTQDFRIDRAEIELHIQPDGSANVVENWLVVPGSQPLDFTREAGGRFHDGISDIHAELVGTAGAPGRGIADAGKVAGRIARWVIDPPPTGPMNLRVRYRVHGLVGVAGLRGSLTWSAFGPGVSAPIGHARLSVVLPESTSLIEDPYVEEAGWTVERTPRGMSAARADIAARATATIGAAFIIDHMTTAQPRWQYQRARASEFVPAFISAGLFILVVGAGVVGMMLFRFSRGDSAGIADEQRRSERANAARDLRRSGFVALVIGIVATVATARLPGGFGPWSYSIAVSVVIVGLSFIAAAPLFRPR